MDSTVITLAPSTASQVHDWLRRRVSGSLGGVCLFARNIGSPAQVRELTDTLRAERDDVVVSIDEEAGDVTRLDAATGALFPGNYALGRVDDVAATEAIGAQVGARLAAAGVTVNFAPCADVLTDPRNPVIGTRSFGSDPELVTRHTVAFQRGQQSAGVAACVKHFPGHGNTTVDTHLGTAVLTGSWDELRTTELPPFRAGLAAGAASVMVGHLVVPAVDNVPATISRRWITDILRGEMGFDGVVIPTRWRWRRSRPPSGWPRAPCGPSKPAPICCAWAVRTPARRS